MKRFYLLSLLFFTISIFFVKPSSAIILDQKYVDSVKIRKLQVSGNIYMLDCINGFGGGNVAVSVGKDGVLLVDDMYAIMSQQIIDVVSKLSTKPIRFVLNTHFHGDHIQGNVNFSNSAVIIGHENIAKRIKKNSKTNAIKSETLPMVTFTDSMKLDFNGEEVQVFHVPNTHTDGDAIVYFTKSKVLHLGDLFFFEMFPAVYLNGGGNIKQLVVQLEAILKRFPADTHVIPGHGRLATMSDLANYLNMLKETIAVVEMQIKLGQTFEQMQKANILQKYNHLGDGGAQSTVQYLLMLYNLLKI